MTFREEYMDKISIELSNKSSEEKENYFNEVNRELKNIRKYREILEERADKYSRVFVLARYLLTPKNFSRIKSIKNNIYGIDNCLEERYDVLRTIYKGRFKHFPEDNLFKKYEAMIKRREDLKNRYYELANMKENSPRKNKKRLEEISEEVLDELKRRERAINDAVKEFSRRGINLEQYYTNVLDKKNLIKDEITLNDISSKN